jgi:hypothetical protein
MHGVDIEKSCISARCLLIKYNDVDLKDGEYREGKQAACVFVTAKAVESAITRTPLWVRA